MTIARIFKKLTAALAAVLLIAAVGPIAGAWYSCDQTVIEGEAAAHVEAIMADLERQSFESEAQRSAVKSAVTHLLGESAFAALNKGSFPYPNSAGYANTVSDGVYSYDVYASGCYAYAKWAEQVAYGRCGAPLYPKAEDGSDITSVWSLSPGLVKDFIRSNCQAGEHLRIDYVHSVCFLACTDEGVYFTDYAGDSKGYIRLCYADYEAFFNAIRTGSSFWLDNVVELENTGAAAPAPTVIRLSVGDTDIRVDGVAAPIDSQGTTPMIINNRTMLPIAPVIRAMGGQAAWDGATRTVTLTLGDKELKLRIDCPEMWDSAGSYALDSAPVNVGGRTMVPLRAVVEYFGAEVAWDGATRTATITYVK